MIPRYTWTPASEPPDTDRPVLAYAKWGELGIAYFDRSWRWHYSGCKDGNITHWRDVEPPEPKQEALL